MDMEKFAEIIKEELQKRVEGEVRIMDVPKNNGVRLCGINIVEEESNFSPVVYLETFLDEYENGMEIDEIVEKIIMIWEKERLKKDFDMAVFSNFEDIKGHIAYMLVNYDANRELLEQIPHDRFLDLARVYFVAVNDQEIGRGSILIYNKFLEMWGVTKEQVEKIAEENTPQLFPISIQKMEDVMKEITGEHLDDIGLNGTSKDKYLMYVASNTARFFGGSVLYYKDKLREFAEQQESNLFILPCSLHELVIVILDGKEDIGFLKHMVQEVNTTQLAAYEVLSWSVYFYDLQTDTISVK